MQDTGFAAPFEPNQPPSQHRHWRRWLTMGGLALALALALGVGTLVGAVVHPTAQAAASTLNHYAVTSAPFVGDNAQYPLANAPAQQGACIGYVVTSVSGSTIVGKASDGSSVTIHTTASTQYTHAGQVSTASAVTVGSQISVMGNRNNDGSITATSIAIH